MKKELFPTIKTEGALLPAELLARVATEDRELPGLEPESYHLAKNERLGETVTRAWNRLRGVWASFRPELERLNEDEPGTGLTRDRWLNILFHELGFGRLSPARELAIDGKSYPISHMWESIPIHLLGAGVSLDRRARGVAGAAVSSPHSLVQEFLNRSEEHLWALVTNGKTLRVLRDNVSFTRQAYLEFDLVSMMETELYSDFKLLWLICHQSRLEGERPQECWLEQWSRQAAKAGTRALDDLRRGVESAIEILGAGFLKHPGNGELRRALESGRLDKQDYYRQVLRLVYRLLFLFVAEDRGLLLDPNAPGELRERYLDHYSTARVRWLASRRRGTRHADLWRGLTVVMRHLGSDVGCPGLALYPLGGYLWSEGALADLTPASLSNHDLLEAIRKLGYTLEKNVLRPVDYKNMGTEELGSVYESLLEQSPELDQSAGTFKLVSLAGNERKSTGSYYTPPELVQSLLDTALEPVVKERIAEARKQGRAQGLSGDALQQHIAGVLLELTVCDPACGSGHFLIAAAHRLAHHLASVRSGDAEPAPEATRAALRDVIGHCIHGVDINPMAVELCKVNLWIECLEPTKPLSFLENKILCGNSLLGATPELVKAGIPDDAFVALLGDDKKHVSGLKKRNAAERKGRVQGQLFDESWAPTLEADVRALAAVDDAGIAGIHRKEELYARWLADPERQREKLVCDAWCAAFVVPKRPGVEAVTEDVLRALRAGQPVAARALVEEAALDFNFFHWHLAFPTVFGVGGFAVVLGNPPWERLKIQEKEWFASRHPEVAGAKTAAERGKKIEALGDSQPELYAQFQHDLRRSEGESHFLHSSGRYPLCGRGDINTYAVFAETNLNLTGPLGRVGNILPTGIATDDTTKMFISSLVSTGRLVSLYGFENEDKLFPSVHHAFKFSLLTVTGSKRSISRGEYLWYARGASEIKDETRVFELTSDEIVLLNPNSGTCPIFRSRRDADLNLDVYRRVPILWREGSDVWTKPLRGSGAGADCSLSASRAT